MQASGRECQEMGERSPRLKTGHPKRQTPKGSLEEAMEEPKPNRLLSAGTQIKAGWLRENQS